MFGESCRQMQRHRALDDAKLAAMIFLKMEKIGKIEDNLNLSRRASCYKIEKMPPASPFEKGD